MLIRSVTANAFGPLVGARMEFADAMTVVHGPNESGKSSWHAAVYAALCGRRRGAGSTIEDREFAQRHQPWDRDDWVVSARVLLDDGRLVELRQDLAGRVDCDAVDLGLGRDCSPEIMNSGTPDGARWLGLDRLSFRATACVSQAQVLDVLRRADGLQAHLQRAASTAGADQTAVAARRRIEEFRAEAVGTERARTKPLSRATVAREAAAHRLARARSEHEAYEQRLVELDGLRVAAGRAERALRRAEAAATRQAAAQARELLAEASAVSARLAGGEPAPPGDPQIAASVAAALASVASDGVAQAAATTMAGPDDGHDDGRGGGRVALLERNPGATPGAEEELYALAHALDTLPPTLDPALSGQVEVARSEVVAALRGRRRAIGLLAAGAVTTGLAVLMLGAAMAGVGVTGRAVTGMAVTGIVVAGAIAAVAGVLLAVGAALAVRRRGGLVAAARIRLGGAELRAATADAGVAESRARHAEAVARAVAAGLVADPVALRAHARTVVEQRAVQLRDERWHQDCVDRLLTAAAAAGVAASTPAEAVIALRAWQDRQVVAASARERHALDTLRLQSLLRGESLAALTERVGQLDRRATVAAAAATSTVDIDLADGDVDAVRADGMDAVRADGMDALRAGAASATRAADAAEVALTQWLAGVADVGEAEAELARADAELVRLRDLDATLEITRTFLARAEETAHRTIAPRLAETVRAWLPEVTDGRYTDVTVDPERLEIHVRGPAGRWRDAGRLSYGTAEQIYLMLRIALAEHLASPGVRCPMLLDDVTVHADGERTEKLLDLLRRASAERQIILFTQQDQVARWAQEHLTGPGHALIRLDPVAVV